MSETSARPSVPGEPPVSGAHPLPRRQFLALFSGTVACGCVCREIRAATDRPVDVGSLADYPQDGISEKFIQYDLFVVRLRGRVYAVTAICPHKANFLLLDPQQPGRIVCSGHESTFDAAGLRQGGPARRALDRFAISLNPAGRLIVDTSRTFREAQWQEPASFVPLP